jgi:hypothetical protein
MHLFGNIVWLIAMSMASSAIAQSTTQTIVVNNRTYTLPSDTPVVIDGEPGQLADLLGQPAGMQLNWLSSGERGTLPVPVFSYTLIGPVTQIDPLEVLGQPVTITGDTVVEGFATVDQLTPGDAMIIAGIVDPNGSLNATLAVRRDAAGNKYLLSGYVKEIAAIEPRLRIGSQWVETGGVFFDSCTGGFPVVGSYVELRADSIAGFQPGDPIDTVTDARCASPVPLGTPGAQGFLEGIVGAGIDGESFMLGPLTVLYDATTVFEFGGPDDLEPGVDLSTEGVFIDATTFDADSVEFVRPVVRFEAPMGPDDVTPGVSLRPLGVVVHYSAQVRDEDGILANGLNSTSQVEVRGWIDRAGVAFATRVRERGDPTPGRNDRLALPGCGRRSHDRRRVLCRTPAQSRDRPGCRSMGCGDPHAERGNLDPAGLRTHPADSGISEHHRVGDRAQLWGRRSGVRGWIRRRRTAMTSFVIHRGDSSCRQS